MKRKIMIFAILVLVISAIVGLYFAYMGSRKNISRQAAKPGLKFSIVACDKELKDIDPHSYPPQEILKISWPAENTLHVEAYVKASCTGLEITGDYEIKDNDFLNVRYSVKGGNMLSKCICTNRMIFEIKDLPPRDYKITLEQQK